MKITKSTAEFFAFSPLLSCWAIEQASYKHGWKEIKATETCSDIYLLPDTRKGNIFSSIHFHEISIRSILYNRTGSSHRKTQISFVHFPRFASTKKMSKAQVREPSISKATSFKVFARIFLEFIFFVSLQKKKKNDKSWSCWTKGNRNIKTQQSFDLSNEFWRFCSFILRKC